MGLYHKFRKIFVYVFTSMVLLFLQNMYKPAENYFAITMIERKLFLLFLFNSYLLPQNCFIVE